MVEWASLAADWEAEGVLVLLPPFCCLTLGSSEDFGLVLATADSVGVDVMGRVCDIDGVMLVIMGRDSLWREFILVYRLISVI